MSVLYFANDLRWPSLLWMRRLLENLGDDVAVLATEADPGAKYRDRYEVVWVRDSPWSVAWRLARRLGLTQSLRKTAKSINELASAVSSDGVEVVLMHYLTYGVKYDRVWRRTDKPVFIYCHGYDVTWDLRHHEAPQQTAHDADYVGRVRALPEHVHFIANSNQTMVRLLNVGIAKHRIQVSYPGVPVPVSAPTPRSSGGELTLLYLGRLVDCKGPELVIRAFDLALKRGMRGRLVMAGDGPMRQECERARSQSSYSDRIDLLGAVDASTGEQLRRSADIFVAHNRRGPASRQEEAFGVSFTEAMAAGLPVVTGANGSLPELIENGVQGILVEPGDVESQAQAFLRLAGDRQLRARMGRSGWQRVRDDFSTENEIRTLRRILGLDNLEPPPPGT